MTMWSNLYILNILAISTCLFYKLIETKDVKFGYTQKEKQIIPEFRTLVEKDTIEKYMLHDSYLVRWIRSTNYDLEKARGKFLNHVQWKKELKNSGYLKDAENLDKLFPYQIIQSLDGRPALFVHFGVWNVRKAELTSRQKNPFSRYLTKLLEELSLKIIELSNSGHENVTNAISFFELTGYNVKTHLCAACLSDQVHGTGILELQYPRLFGDILNINTPRIYETILNLIKPVMGDYYKNVIQLYSLNKSEWEGPIKNLFGQNFTTTNARKAS